MFGLLKKAGDFLAPLMTQDTLGEFKNACNSVIEIAMSQNQDNLAAFIGSLNNITDYLTEELNEIDIPCFDYFSQEKILQTLADSITKDLHQSLVEHLLHFFLAFVTTELNRHFAQVSIHKPFTDMLKKLDILYQKDPVKTRDFTIEVWEKVKTSSLFLEISAERTADGQTFPLFDFLFELSLIPGEDGSKARQILLYMFDQPELDDPKMFQDYIKAKLFPRFVDFIAVACDDVLTVQFNGSLVSLLNWIDQLLLYVDHFPMESVFEAIKKYEQPKQHLSVSLLLSLFTADVVIKPTIELCLSPEFLQTVVDGLDSEDNFAKKCSIAFLKIILLSNCEKAKVAPSQKSNITDILYLIPSGWLVEADGSTSTEAYESDASNRLSLFDQIQNGENDILFPHVIALLKTFDKLSLSLCLTLTHVITLYISICPYLINTELADAFSEAVTKYQQVTTFSVPNENSVDSPEVRAAILAEFGKEIHATFIAAMKLQSYHMIHMQHLY